MLSRRNAVGAAIAGVVLVGIGGVISAQHRSSVTGAGPSSSTKPSTPSTPLTPVVSASAPNLPGTTLGAVPGVWDSLAHCESGGHWTINTGNGLYGGLQLDQRTWLGNGGAVFGALPSDATREQQITIAERVRKGFGGYSAWASCASKLGLR